MSNIVFIDIETQQDQDKILDIGAVKSNGQEYHGNSIADFTEFISDCTYVCGHNIFMHDLKIILPDIEFTR